jgi:hypothetical protein
VIISKRKLENGHVSMLEPTTHASGKELEGKCSFYYNNAFLRHVIGRDQNNHKLSDLTFTIQKQFPVDQKLTIFSFSKDIIKVIKRI